MITLSEIDISAPDLLPLLEQAYRKGLERPHAEQVARLALALFQITAPLHGYGDREAAMLRDAALLHDIGWLDGDTAHHKRSFARIQAMPLPVSEGKRLQIALIARYHRKALPKPEHPGFRSLKSRGQQTVRTLAALLRLADGLDRTHAALVTALDCQCSKRACELACATEDTAEEEREAGLAKGNLFEQVFQRTLTITCHTPTLLLPDA